MNKKESNTVLLERASKIRNWYSSIRPQEKGIIARAILLFAEGTNSFFGKTPKIEFNKLLNRTENLEKLIACIGAVAWNLLDNEYTGEVQTLQEYSNQFDPEVFSDHAIKHWSEMPGVDLKDKIEQKYYSLLQIRNSWFFLLDNDFVG